ncbi:MAG: SymE family type I addiction module toxin [Stenotrophomonas sp.]|uniref:SymE family type I addiction module toxin n=1 Tax=Stenotrophomonas sp. TaxID=69392 RepID=UPI003D6D5931
MQTHWADTPHIDESIDNHHLPPFANDVVRASSAPPCIACDDEPIPYMLLRGHWLRKMGFDIGAKVRVDASEGIICIMMISPPQPVARKPPEVILREGVVDEWPLSERQSRPEYAS